MTKSSDHDFRRLASCCRNRRAFGILPLVSLTTEEELFVQKYKVLSIYSETAKRFCSPAEKYGMEPTGHLRSQHGIRSSPKKARRRRAPLRSPVRPCRMIKELCKIGYV